MIIFFGFSENNIPDSLNNCLDDEDDKFSVLDMYTSIIDVCLKFDYKYLTLENLLNVKA